jgi:hypothetical protein
MSVINQERLVVLETQVENIKDRQEEFIKDNKEDHKSLFKVINDFIKAADGKFATKTELSLFKQTVDDKTFTIKEWIYKVFPFFMSVATLLILIWAQSK